VFRQFTVELGTDLRVRSPGYPYGVPVPPFDLMIGVSMPFDIDHLMGAKVAVEPIAPLAATTGYLTGQVRSTVGNVPVPDAIVTVVGRAHARVATDGDGGFTTLNLPPGSVELEVSAPNFEPLRVVTTVNAVRPENVLVTIRPRAPVAAVHGRVAGREGQGLDATVKFTGKTGTDSNFEVRADATGTYSLTLPAGTYRVRTEARGLPAREAEIQLAVGDDRALDFVLRPAPSSPNVTLAGEAIRIRQPIRFTGVTATLLSASEKTLDAVAELLEAHGEIRRVQIIAHWDNAPLKDGTSEALTMAQAEAVKAYLVTRGISGDRLVTTGAGASKPVVPNLDPASRTRNRRVEFHLE
jgi:outer membrane protein OmpA-like peptidoglycan-associated protein